MPSVERAGGRLPYAEAGGDGAAGAPVVLVGEAGLGPWVLGWQHRALAGPHRSIAVPLRGARVTAAGGATAEHERGVEATAVPAPPDELADLVGDLSAVRRDAGVSRPHLLGVGLGGLVCLAYAADHPVRSLTLLGTPPGPGAVDRSVWRAALPGPGEPAAIRESLPALLSAAFRADQPAVVDGICDWRATEDAAPAARDALLDVLAGGGADRPIVPLHEVTAPALVVCGGADELVAPDAATLLADGLPRGERREEAAAGHLVGVERSRPVNDAVLGFLDGRGSEDPR